MPSALLRMADLRVDVDRDLALLARGAVHTEHRVIGVAEILDRKAARIEARRELACFDKGGRLGQDIAEMRTALVRKQRV